MLAAPDVSSLSALSTSASFAQPAEPVGAALRRHGRLEIHLLYVGRLGEPRRPHAVRVLLVLEPGVVGPRADHLAVGVRARLALEREAAVRAVEHGHLRGALPHVGAGGVAGVGRVRVAVAQLGRRHALGARRRRVDPPAGVRRVVGRVREHGVVRRVGGGALEGEPLAEPHAGERRAAGEHVCMFVAFEVSHPERSRKASDEQPENMTSMFVTLEVSHPETSREASDEQPENMLPMSVTLEVSHPETSREASDEQPENMRSMLAAPDVSSLPALSTSARFAQPANQ